MTDSSFTPKIKKLLDIIHALRDPDTGCPWDREQTHESLRPFVIEEAYETVAAIEDSPDTLSEELGDLLLQILLHAEIASEDKRFSFEDIVTSLTEKLIRRHPHVFGDVEVTSSDEVKAHWERIKKQEKGEQSESTLFSNFPKSFAALYEAYKIGKKSAKTDFDWKAPNEVKEKLLEELTELENELKKNSPNQEKIEEEMGDLLFTAAQLSRKLNIEPEAALKKANRKFIKRFTEMENSSPKPIEELTRTEQEELWNKIKKSS